MKDRSCSSSCPIHCAYVMVAPPPLPFAPVDSVDPNKAFYSPLLLLLYKVATRIVEMLAIVVDGDASHEQRAYCKFQVRRVIFQVVLMERTPLAIKVPHLPSWTLPSPRVAKQGRLCRRSTEKDNQEGKLRSTRDACAKNTPRRFHVHYRELRKMQQ